MIMLQTLPPETCSIIVPFVADKTPLCLLGISFTGSDTQLTAVEAAAKAHGLEFANRSEDGELMVAFLPGTKSGDVAAMFAAARAGRFGGVKYRIMVALQSSAADGIELQKEGAYLDPNQVVLPSQ